MEVPTAEHSAPMVGSANSGSLRIAIERDGAVYLGAVKTPLDEIAPKAADVVRNNPSAGVYLWADKRTRYKDCTEVLDNLRAAGIGAVELIAGQQGPQDAQKTGGNSVPMGEEVLLPGALPPGRHPEGQPPNLSASYPLWDHGRLIAPPVIPKEILVRCGAGWTMGCAVFLVVGRAGNWRLNQDDVSPERVRDHLAEVFQTRAEKVLFFMGDPELDYGTVVKAVDIAHGAGIDKVGMITPRVSDGF